MGSPRLKLRRPYPVSGEVSLVDAGEGFFGGGDEAFAVGFDDGCFRPWAEAGDGFAAGAAGADDWWFSIGEEERRLSKRGAMTRRIHRLWTEGSIVRAAAFPSQFGMSAFHQFGELALQRVPIRFQGFGGIAN